ncbi:unnamed protein product [Boreogadus saida]
MRNRRITVGQGRHILGIYRQRRADTAAVIAESADDFTVPLDDALSLLANSELNDSNHGEEGGSPLASPLRMEGSEPGAAALPVSATTSLPVVGALVAELPGIIARAAANLGLVVPMPQAPQRPDQLHGIWGLEAATCPARLDPIWPMFPARPYFSGAAAEPGQLGAPVKTFIQVTKTEAGARDRRPTPKDQLTAKLTDRAHQCMMQQEAVMNNIALLAHDISTMAADPHRLAERAVDVAKTAGVILCLCSTGAVTAARTAAWQHLIQRNLWLQQTPGISEPMRRQLLECPDRLFGPQLSSMVDEMQAASEEAEKFRRHVSRPPPPPRQQRSAPGSHHRPPNRVDSGCRLGHTRISRYI